MLLEDIDQLSYNELRALAKSFNLKSNRKAVILRAELKKVLSSKAVNSADVLESSVQPVHVDDENEPVVASSPNLVKTSRISSTILPCASSGDEQINLPRRSTVSNPADLVASSPLRSEKSRRTSSTNHTLNVTYELDDPVFCVNTESDVNTVKLSPQEISAKPSLIHTCSETTRAQRTPVANHSATTVSKHHVRPVPDFQRIHAKAASKLESIAHYFKRRHQTRPDPRPPFASPTYRSEARKSLSHPVSVQSRKQLTDRPGRTVDAISNVVHSCNGLGRSMTICMPNSRDSLKKSGSNIPLDSAFARRKAYDSQRVQLRRSATCKSIVANTDRAVVAQTPPRPSKDSHITVRRRDLLTRSVSLYSKDQRQRANDIRQQLRQNAKASLYDSRRGLS